MILYYLLKGKKNKEKNKEITKEINKDLNKTYHDKYLIRDMIHFFFY